MNYIILIFLLFAQIIAFTQSKSYLIKDKTTNQPISLVAIATQKGTGTYSDDFGRFSLSILPNDTLFVSDLSYQKVNLTNKRC